MEVYKFGGASVKDAAAVRNVAEIIKSQAKGELCVVVSAMGKTTNTLESVLDGFYYGRSDAQERFRQVMIMHVNILKDLFPGGNHPVFQGVKALFGNLAHDLTGISKEKFDEAYDKVVSYGEKLSSCIISHYLNAVGLENVELDACRLVLTSGPAREAEVLWNETREQIQLEYNRLMESSVRIMVTQGFIGADMSGHTVTLGREGSDYSAAIFAYCLNADKITIWKDVPGVMNADPKKFANTVLLPYITYNDATELAYYGASVIHPKTIKPLQNKNIPLHVRSFVDVNAPGTWVGLDGHDSTGIPSFICKQNQVLMSIYPKDFSFIEEGRLFEIFHAFVDNGIKVNVMQNSALSFSVCVDASRGSIEGVADRLSDNFDLVYNENVELVTIRHYTQAAIDAIVGGREVLLEQRSRHAAQLVLR